MTEEPQEGPQEGPQEQPLIAQETLQGHYDSKNLI